MGLEPAVRLVRRVAAGRRHPLVLVDGPSGAGKSTFAAVLVRGWPGAEPVVVRVDEAIPGWRGLRRGAAALAVSLVGPNSRGAVGAVHRWDWLADRGGGVQRVRPGRALVVDGCGAFRAGRDRPDAIRVWVDAPYIERRERALARDRGAFDPYWDEWEADWRRYLVRAALNEHAVIRVRLGDRAARGA
ncbi:para-aminobenzoate synthetase [Agromyces flavus]|nr:adenylate kinase [Agromyces flavus]SDS20181.1 para-aminobenzoate synthetase [Agromyces flavus]